MRLYSVQDITQMIFKVLREEGRFPVISVDGRGVIEAYQSSGVVSQTFRITIESGDPE
jgi:hypothetical protein